MAEGHAVGVTGAAGYIGSRVATELLEAGHDVVPVDDFSTGDVQAIDGRRVEDVDVRDRDAVAAALDGVAAVMHLAAESGVPECEETPGRAFDVNVGGTANVAYLCRRWETPLVFPCSMAMVGEPERFPITAAAPREPVNWYGHTKAMSEDDVHHLAAGAFPAHVYMKSNLYGHHFVDDDRVSKGTVINIFVDRALDEKPLEVHAPGTQARDFVHVKDVARAYRLSLDALMDGAPEGARTFPLASGECMSILELAETVGRIVADERGYEVPVEVVENPRGDEAAGEDFTVDTSAAREAIGFEAEHAVADTVRELVRG